MKIKLLYISSDFNYSCGVSKNVYISLKHLSKDADFKLFFITNKGDSLDRLQDIPGLNFTLMNFEKDHKNPFKLIKDFFRLLFYCKKNKIDIIHTHHRYPELLAVIISKFIRIKTITTVHSFVKGMKYFSFRSDKIIAVSNVVHDNLLRNYPHTKLNCTTIYNCIEESFYTRSAVDHTELRKSLGYTETDKILIFAGRISKIKGCDILIEAFKKLPSELNAKLLMIGSISEQSINLSLEKNRSDIKLLKPKKDIRAYYEISDVIVLPSREDPFPYVMLEAGAMRKPFIGSRAGGIAEFIDDGLNGILIEPGNSDQLADKIIFLINNPAQSELLANALYRKVKQECNCEKYFERLDNIYNQLLD